MEPIIYYDYLGWFMLNYSMTEAIVINCIMSALAILLILIFLKFIGSRSGNCCTIKTYDRRFIIESLLFQDFHIPKY